MLNLTNKTDLRSKKTVALSNLSIYYTWKNIKSSYNNNKFKISASTWIFASSKYFLELLTPETMKSLGSSKSKITEDKDGEIVPHLEIVELVLVHCNLVNNDY